MLGPKGMPTWTGGPAGGAGVVSGGGGGGAGLPSVGGGGGVLSGGAGVSDAVGGVLSPQATRASANARHVGRWARNIFCGTMALSTASDSLEDEELRQSVGGRGGQHLRGSGKADSHLP